MEVISKAYGSDTAYKWESTGADGYTLTGAEKDGVGTDVIMHIKQESAEENYNNFLNPFHLENVIKKYSDYIRWPIIMDSERTELEETGDNDENGSPKKEYKTVTEERTVNSMVPIWECSKSEADDKACMEFYKEKFGDGTDPVAVIRVSAEGQVAYKALLFIPTTVPKRFL